MKHKDTEQMLIHVPEDVKRWVEMQARRMLSSQNSEVLRCIRQQMDAAEQPTKKAG